MGKDKTGLVRWKGLILFLVPVLGSMFGFLYYNSVSRAEWEITEKYHTTFMEKYNEDNKEINKLLIDLIKKVSKLEK